MDLFYKRILIVSDNPVLCKAYFEVCKDLGISYSNVDLMRSPSHAHLEFAGIPESVDQKIVRIKDNLDQIVANYDLVISLHCNQLFPKKMVNSIKCINVHPGLNPHNRGWFPQVFSIINGLPIGATIHEIDEEIDHGPIIAQREVQIQSHETSKDVYDRVQLTEIDLLRENLLNILQNTYTVFTPASEGNVQLKSDFKALTEINLDRKVSMQEAIDYLRAMTHGDYKNAFFIDKDTGKKVYVSINLEKE